MKPDTILILSLLHIDFDSSGRRKVSEDGEVVGAFKTVRGIVRALYNISRYIEASNVFWEDSIIKKEAGFDNLLLELDARKYNAENLSKPDILNVVLRRYENKILTKEEVEEFGHVFKPNGNYRIKEEGRMFFKINICRTGKLFNVTTLPEL